MIISIPAQRGGETITNRDSFKSDFLDSYLTFVEENPRDAAALVALIYRDTKLLPSEIFNNVSRHENLKLQLVDNEEKDGAEFSIAKEDYNWLEGYYTRNGQSIRDFRELLSHDIEHFVRKGGLSQLPSKSTYEDFKDKVRKKRAKGQILYIEINASVGKDIVSVYLNGSESIAEGFYEILKILRIELEQKERNADPKEAIPNLKPFPNG